MGRYASAIARFPYLFIGFDVLVAITLGPLTVWIHGYPDLSNPFKVRSMAVNWIPLRYTCIMVVLQGVEARGTEIKGWLNTAQFILEDIRREKLAIVPTVNKTARKTGGEFETDSLFLPGTLFRLQTGDTEPFDPHRTPRLVVSHVTPGQTLLTAAELKSICQLQEEYLTSKCGSLCGLRSLPDTIGDIVNKSCASITDHDVSYVAGLLENCSVHYFTGNLTTRGCASDCLGIPEECLVQDRQGSPAIAAILEWFTDSGFIENGDTSKTTVSHSPVYLPWKGNETDLETFYKDYLYKTYISVGDVYVEGSNLMLGRTLFKWYVQKNLVWFGLAMVLVVVILVLYLRSSVLMLTVILNVAFSLSLSYWFYFMVCRFTFFPFINILASLLLIALGADDLFIFADIWREEKAENPGISQEDLVSQVLHKGGISVFVTSLTTAAALLATLLHDVTAIRCFGAFASICIIFNFLLFFTWVPAIMVLMDRCCPNACQCCKSERCVSSRRVSVFWTRWMPRVVSGGAWFWVVILTLFSVGAFLAVFWKPRLDMPLTDKVRTFKPSHQFEVYTWKLQDQFRFESTMAPSLNIQYIWGVIGKDNGDHLDASDFGHLEFDPDFDPYDPITQDYLAKFCDNVLSANFINDQFKEQTVCYWDLYRTFLGRDCNGTQSACYESDGRTNYTTDKICMVEFARALLSSDASNVTLVGRPLFDENDEVVIFQAFVQTSFTISANYEYMKAAYLELSSFMEDQDEPPTGLASGWFTGESLFEFRFYDTQSALARGTFSGIGVSLAIGCVVILLSTLNAILTFYAVCTIMFVLATTAGTVALMGWDLGPSEAITLTLSTGLSIDFTIHLGVAYTLARSELRKDKVQYAVSSVGSAVTMAALTTLSAGAAMMFGDIWSFRQFGTFLMLTMAFSWVYAMFFFLSLCSLFGPVGNVGNLKACCDRKKDSDPEMHKKSLPDVSQTFAQPDRIRYISGQDEKASGQIGGPQKRYKKTRKTSKQSKAEETELPEHFSGNPNMVQRGSNQDVFYFNGASRSSSNPGSARDISMDSLTSVGHSHDNDEVFLY